MCKEAVNYSIATTDISTCHYFVQKKYKFTFDSLQNQNKLNFSETCEMLGFTYPLTN